ncbi:hypothetical protein V8E36_009195 [Tilletia maclaganii]
MASTLPPTAILLASDGHSPNGGPSNLPALHYRQALVHLLTSPDSPPPSSSSSNARKVNKTPAERIEAHLKKRGWESTWRYKMFKQAHYHSTTHELLSVSSGSATIQLGGGNGEPSTAQDDDDNASSQDTIMSLQSSPSSATGGSNNNNNNNPSPPRTQHTLHLEPGDLLLLPAGYTHHALSMSDDFILIGSYPEGSAPWDMRFVSSSSSHSCGEEKKDADCARYSDEIREGVLRRPRKGLFDASDPAGAADGLEHHWSVTHV